VGAGERETAPVHQVEKRATVPLIPIAWVTAVALISVCPFRWAVSCLEVVNSSVWPPAPDAVQAAEPAP